MLVFAAAGCGSTSKSSSSTTTAAGSSCHEMGFARDIATRVCFLDDGLIREQGSP